MRPSLLPGLLAAARRNLDRGAEQRAAVRDRPPLLARRRRARATSGRRSACCSRARRRRAAGRRGKARGVRRVRRQGRGAGAARRRRRAGRQSAGAWARRGRSSIPASRPRCGSGPKTVLARFGALHPQTLAAFDIDGPVVAVEMFLDAIPAKKGGRASPARPTRRRALQAVTRDFAFLVPAELPAGDLLRAVRGADKANIVDARVFDVFSGQGVPEGQQVAGDRGHAAAGREELHRRGAEGDRRTGSSPRRRSSARSCAA